MQRNLYIKLVLTAIAIELGLLVFKVHTAQEVAYVHSVNDATPLMPAKYNLPTGQINIQQEEPMKVEIVGINMKNWGLPYKYSLPVSLVTKNSNLQLEVIEVPIPVKNK